MYVTVYRQKTAAGRAYEYTATCREENYHFVITGKGETATEADTNLLDNLKEMQQRLDEVAQTGKLSA
ncbi:Uncharacterised protein [Cronobacter sakazakii]|nr:Uncharacterised protein [Cronobacter sakazakii]